MLFSILKKRKAGAFLCTDKCPSVRIFGESRTTFFFRDLLTFKQIILELVWSKNDDRIVNDQNHYFGFGPIPKLKLITEEEPIPVSKHIICKSLDLNRGCCYTSYIFSWLLLHSSNHQTLWGINWYSLLFLEAT